jgi:hypothetical protein
MIKSRRSVRLTIATVAVGFFFYTGLPEMIRPVEAQSSTGCPLPNYPDESCTGVPAGVSLTVVNGGMDINTPNTVIDSKDIRGCISVNAPGVIIRNSKVSCSNSYVVDSIGYSGTWLLIEDSEIHCNDGSGTAVGEENVTIRRSNIHGCENGFDVNKNFTIEDNYIHDLYDPSAAHSDGVQMWNTATGVTIRHNRIYVGLRGTSAIISPTNATLGTIIRDNLFAGGAYTLYCVQGGRGGQQVINNRFSTLYYPNVGAGGPWTECQDEAQVSGNVYHETGKPLPGQTAQVTPSAPSNLTVNP